MILIEHFSFVDENLPVWKIDLSKYINTNYIYIFFKNLITFIYFHFNYKILLINLFTFI